MSYSDLQQKITVTERGSGFIPEETALCLAILGVGRLFLCPEHLMVLQGNIIPESPQQSLSPAVPNCSSDVSLDLTEGAHGLKRREQRARRSVLLLGCSEMVSLLVREA